MEIHLDMSYPIVFSRSTKPLSIELSVEVGSSPPRKVRDIKYFGVTLRADMSWRDEVQQRAKKAQAALNYCRRTFYAAKPDIRRKIYQTLVRTHLEKCSGVSELIALDVGNIGVASR